MNPHVMVLSVHMSPLEEAKADTLPRPVSPQLGEQTSMWDNGIVQLQDRGSGSRAKPSHPNLHGLWGLG